MFKEKMVTAIIVAAGKGKRMGKGFNKQYILLQDKPIVVHTLETFEKAQYIDDVILVVAKEEVAFAREKIIKKYNLRKVTKVIEGGEERQDSVYAGLLAVKEDCQIVVIHDGARPFVEEEMIKHSISLAAEFGAAIVAVPVKDTIKKVNSKGHVIDTPDRKELWSIQTPQTFQYDLLKKAHDDAQEKKIHVTDDAMMVERLGHLVKVIKGSYENIKITTPEDLIVAEGTLQRRKSKMRVGLGYDVHQLVEGRKLIIGGVEIPYKKGLLGHSDADVLVHGIMDAILGALALGDIGKHFPDTEEKYKDADSLKLLEEIGKLLAQKGYAINNIDATIIAQAPKMATYIEKMRENIATVLNISVHQVNVKATTTEGLGFAGRGEGIAAQAIAAIVVK